MTLRPLNPFRPFEPLSYGVRSITAAIRAIFANGEQGWWYDPSDLSTLYQDSAGTTPVTAMEQFVGLILDKSGRGNHAYQTTLPKRMKVSRRVNLLTKTEDFADAVWTRAGASLNAAGASPNGNQATKLIAENGTQVSSVRTTAVQSCVGVKILAKFGGTRYLSVALNQYDTYAATFDLVDGLVTQQPTAYSGETADIVSVGDGWYECTRKFASGGLKNLLPQFVLSGSPTGNSTNTTIEGNGVDGVFVAEPSVCRTVEGVGLPYQRVNTATDYDDDPAKFPTYELLDGIDDSASSSAGGGGTTGFFFSAAVEVGGGAGTNRTLFSDAGTNTGYIVRLNTSNQLEFAAGNGTAYTTIATAARLAVGALDIVQAWDDGTNLNVRIGNGAVASIARPTVSAGTAATSIGQDNGASTGYFNGRIYSQIYRKDSGLTADQREQVRRYQHQQARFV